MQAIMLHLTFRIRMNSSKTTNSIKSFYIRTFKRMAHSLATCSNAVTQHGIRGTMSLLTGAYFKEEITCSEQGSTAAV
jgi:hypothetical protein